MAITNVPIGPLINILKFFAEPFRKLKRKRRLEGYYLVYHQNSTTPVVTSPEGIPNVLKLEIDFWKPNILKIRAKDFDRTYRNIWKTWEGRITMNDDIHGKGYYNYLENNEPGDHEIWCMAPGTIRVRITDKGKANLKEKRDNDPATQQWKKIDDNDPLIPKFQKMLSKK